MARVTPADLATVLIPFGIICFVLGWLTAIWEPQPPRSPLSRAATARMFAGLDRLLREETR